MANEQDIKDHFGITIFTRESEKIDKRVKKFMSDEQNFDISKFSKFLNLVKHIQTTHSSLLLPWGDHES